MQKYVGKMFIDSAYPRYLSERVLMVYRKSSSSSPVLLSPLLPVSRHGSEREGSALASIVWLSCLGMVPCIERLLVPFQVGTLTPVWGLQEAANWVRIFFLKEGYKRVRRHLSESKNQQANDCSCNKQLKQRKKI